MRTANIRIDNSSGMSIPSARHKTAYISGIDFEPDEPRMQITADGTAELVCNLSPPA